MSLFSKRNRDRAETGLEVAGVGWSLFKWIRALVRRKRKPDRLELPPAPKPPKPPPLPPGVHRQADALRCRGRSKAQGARCDLPTNHAGPHRTIWP